MKNCILLVLLLAAIGFLIGGGDCKDIPVTQQPTDPHSYFKGVILKTTNGGLTWNETIRNDINSILAIGCLSADPNTFTMLENNTNLRYFIDRTTDFGVTFSTPVFDNYNIYSIIAKIGPGKGMISGNTGIYYTTSNDGVSWETAQFQISDYSHDIDFGNEMTGIILPENPRKPIRVTTDGGATFNTKGVIDSTYYQTGIKFVNGATDAVVCGYDGKLYRTTNVGDSWDVIVSPENNKNLYSIDFLGPVGITVGEGGTILRSSDGGYAWEIIPSGITKDLNKAFMDTDAYYIAGNGIILKSSDQGLTWGACRIDAAKNFTDLFFVKGKGVVTGITPR